MTATRALLTLVNDEIRARAIHWIRHLPVGTRVEFMAPLRTLPQNKKMWVMLRDVADQIRHHGLKLSDEDWKDIFATSLKRELRMVPNLEGDSLVTLGRSTSNFSVEEMSFMIELMYAFAANHGVVWTDPQITSQLEQIEHRPHPKQLEHAK